MRGFRVDYKSRGKETGQLENDMETGKIFAFGVQAATPR